MNQIKIRDKFLNVGQKMAATRFILMMVPAEMVHIKSLPDVVFQFIFIEGHLVDLPWVKFIEDDFGTSIARTYQYSIYHNEMYELLKKSRFISRSIPREIGWFYSKRIGIQDIEKALLIFAQHKAYNSKSVF